MNLKNFFPRIFLAVLLSSGITTSIGPETAKLRCAKKKFFCSPTCTDITNNSGLHFFPYQTAEIQSSRRTAVKKKKKRTQDGKGNAGVVASTDLYSVLRMRCWMGTASSYLPNERILTRCVRAVCLSLVNRAELKVDHSKNKKLRHVADSMP